MSFDFTGRKVIICGGSRGIGRAIALGMAAAGAGVSICARGLETLEATRREIAAFGQTAHAASVDLGDQSALKAYIGGAAAALGGIDVLVNNASAFGSADDEAAWAASLAIDMLAIVHATQAALPFLQDSKGCVVNTSSISALRAAARQPPYGAIKAAVIHYTGTQAALYAKDGIRVNCIAPGSIEFAGGVQGRGDLRRALHLDHLAREIEMAFHTGHDEFQHPGAKLGLTHVPPCCSPQSPRHLFSKR